MKNFAIIGVAGFIAPKHLQAIKDTGNNLLAAFDISDSVGILDHYFPNADFFTEFERFERFLELQKRSGNGIDYLVVCSPNYLHDTHARFGLRLGANIICEKPVVLNPWNLDALIEMEEQTGKNVFPVHQLRFHPEVIALKKSIDDLPHEHFRVNLNYHAPRGRWYQYSWKGNEDKSGGITTNIGVHFFDLFNWLFGNYESLENVVIEPEKASGQIKYRNAEVNWTVSTENRNGTEIPNRLLTINGKELNLNAGHLHLHTDFYQAVLKGEGLRLREIRNLIALIYQVRNFTNLKN